MNESELGMNWFATILAPCLVMAATSIEAQADPIAAILNDPDVREGWLRAPDPDPLLTLALVTIGLLCVVALTSEHSGQLKSDADD